MRLLVLVLLVASLAACAVEEPLGPTRDAPSVHEPASEPPVEADEPLPPPVAGAAIYPETMVRLVADDPRDVERLADVETCASCHEEVYAAWRASPHAAASFDNPWYRQAVDAIREQRGPEASRFCGGCHDPLLLVADAMDEPVEPSDPRAHAGITCMVCHGIQEARPDGNASYTLRTSAVPIPDPASEEEVAAHVAALTPEPLRTAALCGTCHRGFLGPHMENPHHLPGVDDPTAWGRSGYAGSPASRLDQPVEQATCQGCHMGLVPASDRDFATDDGQIHTHRVPGGHTALAGARGDDAQLAAIQARLADVVRIDVAAARSGGRSQRPADGARLAPGRVELDVVVRNLGVGHRFPGGTLDLQDTWIEVEVRDARGALLAEAGTRHAEAVDDTAHRFVAAPVDDDANVQVLHHVQDFRAVVLDRTLGPRDAEAIRYAFELPEGFAAPLSVDARLRHRRHTHAMRDAACEATRDARGREFTRAGRALGRTPIDGCAPLPITELAAARVWLGAGSAGREATGGAAATPFQRAFDHALALISDVQEHLDDARPSIAAALRHAPDDHTRAMAYVQLARLEGRQGRLEAALAAAARAERLVGERPSIHRVRADAYAQVWRWDDAAESYRRAAEGAPRDESRWVDLARALGSAGRDEEALAAADTGLALTPRSPGLLRSRALALEALGRPEAAAARDVYLGCRVPDALSTLRLRCGRDDAWCARERLPVHVHELRTAGGHASPAP